MKRRIFGIFLCFAILISLFSELTPVMAGVSAFDDIWHWANPKPQGNDLKAAAYGGGRYAAVGESGAVITSADNETWTRASSDFDSDYNTVAYGNGLFVAGGNGGYVGKSADGVNWTYDSSDASDDILGIAFGNSIFVAVGDGYIMISSDGDTWTSGSDPDISGKFNGVAYANGYFIAVGDNGRILYSGNGLDWEVGSNGDTTDLNSVTYGTNGFVAVGQNGMILTAATPDAAWTKNGTIYLDGSDFTASFSSYLYSAAYGNGIYVIASESMYLTSSDGTNWTVTLDENGLAAFYGVVYGDGGFAAVGAGGIIVAIDSGSTGWTERSSGSKSYLAGMTYDNSLFVAVGTNEIMTSSNGINWLSRSAPAGVGTLESVAGNGSGGYAAVGYGYNASDNYIGTLAYSTDGTTWQKATTVLGTDMMLKGVAYGLNPDGIGLYVAVGSSWSDSVTGVIYTSEDGDNWSQVTTGSIERLTDVTYGNGIFVAVGEGDTLMTSVDGMSWTTMSRVKTINPGIISYTGIAYGEGLFVAVGNNGEIIKSLDGTTWDDMEKYSGNLSCITYGSGYFVSAGQSGLILRCAVSSGVADTWERTGRYMTTNRLNAAAYGNGVYAVVGEDGTILYSGSAAPVPTMASAANNTVSVNPASVTVGGSTTITAAGDRQSVAGAVTGDERYVPTTWTSTEAVKNGTFTVTGSTYTSSYTPSSAGSYTITATFQKQTWNGTAWNDVSGSTDIKTVPLSVNSSGGDSSSTDSTTTVGTSQIGLGSIIMENDTATATVDSAKLAKEISGGKPGSTIVLVITGNVNNADFNLTVADLKAIADNGSMLQLESPMGIYKLPATEIDFDNISKQYPNIGYKDIKVTVAFSKADGNNAILNGSKLVGQPVSITVSLTAGDKVIELDEFTQYVERDLTVPDGSRFTTGVVIEKDGTLRPVPTKTVTINGKKYAAIFSRTNSIYALASKSVSFDDMEGHWAMAAVNDLASRLVIIGVGNNSFAPGQDITRVEFAAIVVRAMGLKTSDCPAFTDVKAGSWCYGAVAAAYKYGIVSGYGDGTFKPESKITRQEAMAMIARAMKVAGMDTAITDGAVTAELFKFIDGKNFSAWARQSAAAVIRSGLVVGSEGYVRPEKNITRAETAVIVRRLLVKAGLI